MIGFFHELSFTRTHTLLAMPPRILCRRDRPIHNPQILIPSKQPLTPNTYWTGAVLVETGRLTGCCNVKSSTVSLGTWTACPRVIT